MRILPNITNPHTNNVIFFRVIPCVSVAITDFVPFHVSLLASHFVISTYSVAIKNVQDLTGTHDLSHQQD
jgi:hypothetical protein